MAKPKKKVPKKPSEQLLSIDPTRIRYQHSRIRPHFSGCGRSVSDTLESIKSGHITVDDLPPIQVLIGPSDNDGVWYFTLNNRRLWVLKQLRAEGHLVDRNPSNTVQVRVREAKSKGEKERYTLENCSVDAKFIREKVKENDDIEDYKKDEKHIDLKDSKNEKPIENSIDNELQCVDVASKPT